MTLDPNDVYSTAERLYDQLCKLRTTEDKIRSRNRTEEMVYFALAKRSCNLSSREEWDVIKRWNDCDKQMIDAGVRREHRAQSATIFELDLTVRPIHVGQYSEIICEEINLAQSICNSDYAPLQPLALRRALEAYARTVATQNAEELKAAEKATSIVYTKWKAAWDDCMAVVRERKLSVAAVRAAFADDTQVDEASIEWPLVEIYPMEGIFTYPDVWKEEEAVQSPDGSEEDVFTDTELDDLDRQLEQDGTASKKNTAEGEQLHKNDHQLALGVATSEDEDPVLDGDQEPNGKQDSDNDLLTAAIEEVLPPAARGKGRPGETKKSLCRRCPESAGIQTVTTRYGPALCRECAQDFLKVSPLYIKKLPAHRTPCNKQRCLVCTFDSHWAPMGFRPYVSKQK